MSTNGKRRTKKATVEPPCPLDGTDGQIMVISAFRYCLGSRSYVVGACMDWLCRWWHKVDRNSRRTIVRDIVESLMDDRAGWECDAQGWMEFASWAYDEMPADDREWVMNDVAHKNKPWPLIVSAIPEVGG